MTREEEKKRRIQYGGPEAKIQRTASSNVIVNVIDEAAVLSNEMYGIDVTQESQLARLPHLLGVLQAVPLKGLKNTNYGPKRYRSFRTFSKENLFGLYVMMTDEEKDELFRFVEETIKKHDENEYIRSVSQFRGVYNKFIKQIHSGAVFNFQGLCTEFLKFVDSLKRLLLKHFREDVGEMYKAFLSTFLKGCGTDFIEYYHTHFSVIYSSEREGHEISFDLFINAMLQFAFRVPGARVFEDPVNDTVAENYSEIVTRPMCFQTLRDNIAQGLYVVKNDLLSWVHAFLRDLLLIFTNCIDYHGSGFYADISHRFVRQIFEFMRRKNFFVVQPKFEKKDIRDVCVEVVDKVLIPMDVENIFNTPVNDRALPFYSYFVTQPLDLIRIRRKAELNHYKSMKRFIDEVHLMLENAMVFNGESSYFYKYARQLKTKTETAITAYFSSFDVVKERITLTKREKRELQLLNRTSSITDTIEANEKFLKKFIDDYAKECDGKVLLSTYLYFQLQFAMSHDYYGNFLHRWSSDLYPEISDSVPFFDYIKKRIFVTLLSEVFAHERTTCDDPHCALFEEFIDLADEKGVTSIEFKKDTRAFINRGMNVANSSEMVMKRIAAMFRFYDTPDDEGGVTKDFYIPQFSFDDIVNDAKEFFEGDCTLSRSLSKVTPYDSHLDVISDLRLLYQELSQIMNPGDTVVHLAREILDYVSESSKMLSELEIVQASEIVTDIDIITERMNDGDFTLIKSFPRRTIDTLSIFYPFSDTELVDPSILLYWDDKPFFDEDIAKGSSMLLVGIDDQVDFYGFLTCFVYQIRRADKDNQNLLMKGSGDASIIRIMRKIKNRSIKTLQEFCRSVYIMFEACTHLYPTKEKYLKGLRANAFEILAWTSVKQTKGIIKFVTSPIQKDISSMLKEEADDIVIQWPNAVNFASEMDELIRKGKTEKVVEDPVEEPVVSEVSEIQHKPIIDNSTRNTDLYVEKSASGSYFTLIQHSFPYKFQSASAFGNSVSNALLQQHAMDQGVMYYKNQMPSSIGSIRAFKSMPKVGFNTTKE
ncbi:hypothetical protein PCE1_004656 [Barthelona sp. PCE]